MEKAEITPGLVERLVAAQFPRWSHLAVAPVELDGWDNTTFRLGRHLSVRLPSHDIYVAQVDKEHRWLPILAPQLPVRIPEPVARGDPGSEFPRPWSVYRWLRGEHATVERVAGMTEFAADLTAFLARLYAIDPAGGPVAGSHNFFRGAPLATYDGDARESIAALRDEIDAAAAADAWEAALAATWDCPDVWVHGDVTASNLLVLDGRLSAVIDFGCSGVGDPACDLTMAWTFFSGAGRQAFREGLPFDDGTWARGRGWALWKAMLTLAKTMQPRSDAEADPAVRFGWRLNARAVIDEVLADHARSG